MKYRNISKHNTRAAVLTLVLAVTLLLTTTFSVAFLHGNAASLHEKKTGWYAMQKDAVDLGFNGVLQNKFGSWFVEDGKVNFSYTGWLVCEGTYYYVTSGKADKPASLPTFAIPKTKSSTAGTNSATTAKAGTNSVNGTNSGSQTSNSAGNGSASSGTKNSNSGSASNETNGSNASGNATKAANKQTTKAPATTKAAATTKKASTTKKANTKPTTKKPSTKAPTQPQTQPATSEIPVTMDEDELPIIAD